VEVEEAFRRKNPVDIVQAAQRALNKASRNPPLILRGRWMENVAKTGNFVYRMAGDILIANILACKDQLCKLFPAGESWIVPTKGWTWVQLRGVDVSYMEDDVQFIYEDSQLLEAFATNLCFQGADIMVPPHFQGNPANFKLATAMVIAAISDVDNSHCQRATLEGVCMFGRQVKFVHAGDNPSLVQCSRCHEVGHYFSSPKCRVKPDAHRCFRCGGAHHSDNHDFECTKPHAVQGICNCIFKCILCKGDGHHARDKKCPRQGDFVPPRLTKFSPVETTQGVDSRMVAPLAVAQPPCRRQGKDIAKADSGKTGVDMALREAAAVVPEGICATEGVYTLLCFCCPLPPLETYQRLYVPKEGVSSILSNLRKSIIDLHSEFGARKAAGEAAIREAQTTHSKIFHQDKELAAVISRCECAIGRDMPYGPMVEGVPEWIRTMPMEEQIGEAAQGVSSVKAAAHEVEEWQAAKGGGPLTLHTMMQGGPVNLRWTGSNCFAPIDGANNTHTPSKVTENV
jgi:hypothetical protein